MALRELTPEEVAAMWLYGADYGKSNYGAIEWWRVMQRDNPSRTRNVRDFVQGMHEAFERSGSFSAPNA